MSEHKRNIYPTLWIKDKSLFDLLFKKTLPTFVMCESEKLLANYCVIYKKNITTELTPNNRQVFDSLYLFNADANRVKSELETHFFRLCKYKNSNSAVINGMLKQAWRENRHEAQLGVTHVAKMIDCNCILTDTTKWSLEFPDKTQLTVSTVDDEMCCTAWIWACKIMHTVCNAMLSEPCTESDIRVYLSRTKEHVKMLREAATLFAYLTMHGSKEMFSRFMRSDPIFFKAYVCFAYQKLAEGLAHVLQANYLIRESCGITLAPEAIEYLQRATLVLESGYKILKNEKNGADDAGIDLPLAYNHIRVWALLYHRFYHARFLSVTTSMLKTCYLYMQKIIDFKQVAENREALTALYNDVVEFDEKIESASTLSYITTTLTKLVMPNNGTTFDKDSIALDELLKLEPMASIPYNEHSIVVFKIPTVDQFLFSIFNADQ